MAYGCLVVSLVIYTHADGGCWLWHKSIHIHTYIRIYVYVYNRHKHDIFLFSCFPRLSCLAYTAFYFKGRSSDAWQG